MNVVAAILLALVQFIPSQYTPADKEVPLVLGDVGEHVKIPRILAEEFRPMENIGPIDLNGDGQEDCGMLRVIAKDGRRGLILVAAGNDHHWGATAFYVIVAPQGSDTDQPIVIEWAGNPKACEDALNLKT